MKRLKTRIVNIFIVLCLFAGTVGRLSAAESGSVPPDLTQGGKRDDNHDWNLGATGARGWVYGSKGQTSEARQILVTAVAAGSPADGILSTNDVILGVNDKPFADDARKSLGYAITVAEEKKGLLRLIRWRDGQSANVDLKLAVLGKYSDTAPYDCQKSKKIFEQGCRLIAKNGLKNAGIPIHFNALALLASGREEYRPMLAEYARKVAASLHPGMWTWYYGYGNMFLAEYVMATGDESILPDLKRTAMESTMGQSAVGTWGHEFYTTASGNLNGYGCMNQPGISVTLSLWLARQAGVTDPAVAQAIDKSAKFLRYYVDKGAIPYGDHQPWPGHEDNGKCSSAAVLFDLLGDREAAAFFARMAMAGYAERERGHTGNFFNVLWAVPGVSRCGPLATGTYIKELSWYYDLARCWDGSFAYQGSPAGEEEFHKYTDWDCTGAYLLAYALPLKSLCVTGKKPCSVLPLKRKEVEDVITAGRDYFSSKSGYQGRTVNQLLAGLSSWSPAVRKRSAQALGRPFGWAQGRCEGDFLPALLKMLAGSDRYGRYGACEALGCLGARADAAAPQLLELFKDHDPWLQSLACNAIASLGPEVRKASLNEIMALAARNNPDDPRGMTHRAAAVALFSPYPGSKTSTIFNNSLDGIDRQLLYPAMRSVLRNDDAAVRLSLAAYLDKLTDRDLAVMLPDIIKAIEEMAPSDEMFADSIRLAGLNLLSQLRIREGMELCVSTIEWRWGNNLQKRLEYLTRYGSCAKAVVPQLQKKIPEKSNDAAKMINKCIADIEASTNAPTLVDLKDFIAHASAKISE